jgi:hypothetical protein
MSAKELQNILAVVLHDFTESKVSELLGHAAVDPEGNIDYIDFINWVFAAADVSDSCEQPASEAASPVPAEDVASASVYDDFDWSKFDDVLQSGSMSVVKASYFKRCLESNEPFKDRSNIPSELIYKGEEALSNWKTFGNLFLIIFSYSWLKLEFI